MWLWHHPAQRRAIIQEIRQFEEINPEYEYKDLELYTIDSANYPAVHMLLYKLDRADFTKTFRPQRLWITNDAKNPLIIGFGGTEVDGISTALKRRLGITACAGTMVQWKHINVKSFTENR